MDKKIIFSRYEWEHCVLRQDIKDRRVIIGKKLIRKYFSLLSCYTVMLQNTGTTKTIRIYVTR
jgi:hypothetical protein